MATYVGPGESGVTHDTFGYNSAGQIYNVSTLAFVAAPAAGADPTNFRIPTTEIGGTGDFVATLPSGVIHWALRRRGGTVATSYKVAVGDVESGGGGGGGISAELEEMIEETHAKVITFGNGVPVVVTGPVLGGAKLGLIQGFDWTVSEGGAITMEEPTVGVWPATLAAATTQKIYFVREGGPQEFSGTGTFLAPLGDGRKRLQYTVTRDELKKSLPGSHLYYIGAEFASGFRISFAKGRLDLAKGPTP